MAGSLSDPRVRVRWARRHLNTLRDEFGVTPLFDWHPVTVKRDPKGFGDGLYVGELEPIKADVALVVSDCLFNLRSALDQLVYQLHVRRWGSGLTDAMAGASAFPIITTEDLGPPRCVKPDPATWRGIKNLGCAHRTAIGFLQPFVTRHDSLYNMRRRLGTLNALNNIDKHRHLHLTRRKSSAVVADVSLNTDTDLPIFGPLESYAKVVEWNPPKRPTEMDMYGQVASEVALYEGGELIALYPLLDHLVQDVDAILNRFARYFPA